MRAASPVTATRSDAATAPAAPGGLPGGGGSTGDSSDGAAAGPASTDACWLDLFGHGGVGPLGEQILAHLDAAALAALAATSRDLQHACRGEALRRLRAAHRHLPRRGWRMRRRARRWETEERREAYERATCLLLEAQFSRIAVRATPAGTHSAASETGAAAPAQRLASAAPAPEIGAAAATHRLASAAPAPEIGAAAASSRLSSAAARTSVARGDAPAAEAAAADENDRLELRPATRRALLQGLRDPRARQHIARLRQAAAVLCCPDLGVGTRGVLAAWDVAVRCSEGRPPAILVACDAAGSDDGGR